MNTGHVTAALNRAELNRAKARLAAWQDELQTNRHGLAHLAPGAIDHNRKLIERAEEREAYSHDASQE